jgi:hypothetical protein
MIRWGLFLVTLFVALFSVGQHTVEIEFPWQGDFLKAVRYEEEQSVLAIRHEYNVDGKPVFIHREELKNSSKFRFTTTISELQTVPASSFDLTFINEHNLTIQDQLEFKVASTTSRGKEYVGFEIVPFIKVQGQIRRVKRVQFSLEQGSPISGQMTKNFAASSVLGSGQWYKIRVARTGVFRIDRAFLEQLGINVNGLNPNHINIYGYHTGMLPEANNVPRPDDLVKNAIFIQGDQDNSFDAGDFILFYATGPDELTFSLGTGFSIVKNLYDDFSYYYIHIDGGDAPKRIGSADLAAGAPTHTVEGIDQVVTHERDERNLIKSGKRWYGEEFDFTLEHTFPFNLTGLQTTEPVRVFSSIAYTNNGGSHIMRVFLNNSQTHTHSFTVVGGNNFANRTFNTSNQTITSPNASVKLVLERSNPSVVAWLDKLELRYRRSLNYTSGQLELRDSRTVGPGNIARYTISGMNSSVLVWEVTDPYNVGRVNGTLTGSNFDFSIHADQLRQFIAFTTTSALVPQAVGRVTNQNLHALDFADYLIVTHPSFLQEANRLADLHREDGMTVHVVTAPQIYNEFSSGKVDPVAIRWFVKMFYDRANGNANQMPKYLCLFGDGTYDPKDRVPNNNYLLPTYQSDNSENTVASLTSDDFFGLLDDSESMIGSDMLDVGIGRIIATSTQQARTLVNKIEHYKRNGSKLFANSSGGTCNATDNSTFGDWRLWITHIADDEDNGQFVLDHESYVTNYGPLYPELNIDKIYLDAFKQVTTSGGQRYPEVPPLINSRIERGTLVMNYVGHGSETGLALERIIVIPQILDWRNIDRLPLFVSATCEFTRFDDPARLSAGEHMYLSGQGGAISMMTTTRPVFINVNSVVGAALYDYIFLRESNGEPLGMGEILRLTKNNSTTDQNRRSFMLLGDPALKLALPELKIVVDSINGKSPNVVMDTLRSLSKVTIKARVVDENGNTMTGFNGTAVPAVLDKPRTTQTLGQDLTSPVMTFQTQKNFIYRGKSTVTNGHFEFTFVVPKDIDYSFGNGKISLYANSTQIDGSGAESRVIVGGVNPNGLDDNIGPDVTLFMNDEKFVNGGMTNERPIFFAKVFDENGINAVGNGIGHDITLVLDGKTAQPIILNDYYEADLDSYQSGRVRYQFENLEPGRHTLSFKVWDVNNNSSDTELEFVVVKNDNLSIKHLLNYPNPFTTYTEFFFEHNQVDVALEVQIQIFTVSGRLVKTINQYVNTCGFRTNGIPWDGRDDFGDQLAKGVYMYKVTVTAPDGSKADKLEKLVLLK